MSEIETAPLVTKGRFHSLDGIRGIASFTVVFGHCLGQAYEFNLATLTPGHKAALETYFKLHGFTVPVFMCLSGFVLGLQSLKNLQVRGGLLKYGYRRAKRILPAYYFALCFSLAIAVLLGKFDLHQTWSKYAYNLISPILLLDDFWGSPNDYNVPLWSLPVEWHAYMLLPAVLFFWNKVGGLGATMAVVTLSCVLMALTPWATCHYYLIFFTGVATAYVCGSLIGCAADLARKLPWTAILAIALILQIAVLLQISFEAFQGAHFITEITWGLVAALLITALSNDRLPHVDAFLNTSSIQWLGQRSYSMYLLHWPVLMLVQSVVLKIELHSFSAVAIVLVGAVVPLTFAISSLSWLVFEGQSGRENPRPIWPWRSTLRAALLK